MVRGHPPSLPEADASDAPVEGLRRVNGLAMRIQRMSQKRPVHWRRCWRCDRTIAHCGDNHYVQMWHGWGSRNELHQVCCWCVIELNGLGVVGMVIETDVPTLCPVRVGAHLN